MSPPAAEDEEVVEDEPTVDLPRGERFEKVRAHETWVYETFDGRISAEGRVEVRAPQGMRAVVVEIPKNEGDFVSKGDVLVRFSREAIEADIERARAAGREDLVKVGEEWLKHVEIRAPVDGVVKEIYTEVGRVPVDEGIPLVWLADRSAYKLRVQVPEGITSTVAHMGAKLTAELEGGLGEVTGTVASFEPATEGSTFLVIGLDPKEGLEVDMRASLRVPTTKREVGLVPKAAVEQRGTVKVVRAFEPSDRTICERTIVTDGEQGTDWIVVAGVFPGDSIVVPDARRER
jgi:multidrug efflux pump subunit AcrA (membrane-fusion protein)